MRALYVPERFAHGYQALVDDTDASYEMGASTRRAPKAACPTTIPARMDWPLPVTVISARDRNFQPLEAIEGELGGECFPRFRGRCLRSRPFDLGNLPLRLERSRRPPP